MRPVRLAARDAARRFPLRRRNAAQGRGEWLPLVLFWRRRRKRTENAIVRRNAPAVRVSSFSQIRVHHAMHVSNPTRVERQFFAGATLQFARVMREHQTASFRHTTVNIQAPRVFRSWNTSHSKVNTLRTVAAAPPRMTWPVAPFALKRSGQFAQVSTEHTIWRREERRVLSETRSSLRLHSMQTLSLRAPAFTDSTARRSPDKNVPRQRPFEQREELVWRRASRPAPESIPEEQHATPSTSMQRTSMRHDATHPVSARAERPVTPQITKFDPALLDRLTDDVIRRVERRMRIERERRGL